MTTISDSQTKPLQRWPDRATGKKLTAKDLLDSGTIVLTTFNARYIHASLGLRYLYANMGSLQSQTLLREFTIANRASDITESLLAEQPIIVGIGVYIWNVALCIEVMQLIKTIAPDVIIIAGGPEITERETTEQLVATADYLISGQADVAFSECCTALLTKNKLASQHIRASNPPLAMLHYPYEYYSDNDLKNRIVYVEASRGCPFKCEFCLSSLDKTAWPFSTDLFLQQMQSLHDRGLRNFKFVDRTFNLKIATSQRILQFFLDRLDDQLFLHFEVIPDKLPEALKKQLAQFPPGVLQLEVGIQSFNPPVQATISRKQNNQQCAENLRWLQENTSAHIHADLIFGLPGESLESFAAGFNKLYELAPQEIQLGLLKRLNGTPITRHTETHDMRYSPVAPYSLLSNDQVDFATVQRITRFARYWDLMANSGRFTNSLPLLLGDNPFYRFLSFSNWCYAQTGRTHKLRPETLLDLLFDANGENTYCANQPLLTAIEHDYQAIDCKKPRCLSGPNASTPESHSTSANHAARQLRHSERMTAQKDLQKTRTELAPRSSLT